MHWISKKDLESERYRWVKNGYRGFGSINKRYSWIIEKFKLEDNEDFKKWLTPIVIRRLVAPYPDNPGTLETLPTSITRSLTMKSSDYSSKVFVRVVVHKKVRSFYI